MQQIELHLRRSSSQGLVAGEGSWSITGKRVVPCAVIHPKQHCCRKEFFRRQLRMVLGSSGISLISTTHPLIPPYRPEGQLVTSPVEGDQNQDPSDTLTQAKVYHL
ncbi:hypothetical protein SLA2020_449200 [Shorea laevis]